MNRLRTSYKEIGKEGLTLLVMIVFLAALYLVGVAFSLQQ